MQTIPPIQDITLVTELHQLGVDDRPFRRATRRGDAVRIHRGAYMAQDAWRSLNRDGQYRHQVIAASLASRSRPTLSHHSAATAWGIPLIGSPPKIVHVLASMAAGTRTEGSFRRHATRAPDFDVEFHHGVPITSLRRTLVELAMVAPFGHAVAALDWALNPENHADRVPAVDRRQLWECVELLGISRGRTRVERAIDFARDNSGSPGESVSRACIYELGFPAPILQQRFEDRRGLIGFTDFWWPEFRLFGEFDGLVKYTRDDFMKGRSIDQVVLAEKQREDRLRGLGLRPARWLWPEVTSPWHLFTLLTDAGLPTWRRSPPMRA